MPPPSTPRRHTRLRVAGLTVALALLLAACAPPGAPGGGQPGGMPHDPMPMGQMHERDSADDHDDRAPAPVEDAAEARISATEMAFSPSELELTAGEPVNVTVVNDGQAFHDFDVPAADVHLNLDPGELATAAITLDEPGTYEATCTVPGHASAGMVLTLHVS